MKRQTVSASEPSTRARRVDPFIVMDVLRDAKALEAAGVRVAHMEVGQPGGRPPRKVLEAAARALEREDLGYTEAHGIPALRERIARYYADMHGIDVPLERIFITTGSSGAFTLALVAAFDAGARVGLANPGYPAYRNILHALNLEPVLLPAGPRQDWAPALKDVRAQMAAGMAGVLLASPVNPTGAMLHRAHLRALIQAVEEEGGVFISDEIYHRLTYDEPAETALVFSDDVYVINSFSKYYAMTGWRIGWMVVPEAHVRAVEVLAQNMFINAPTIAQHAALAAFDAEDELEERRARYAANRALLLQELPRLGLSGFSPAQGAFYLYCDVGNLTNDSVELTRRILNEAHVAITPGVDFDPVDGRRFVRFSYCATGEDIEAGLERLAQWLQRRPV